MVEMSTITKEKELMREAGFFLILFARRQTCDRIERDRLLTYNVVQMPVNELVLRQEKGREFV